jgi:hypothetical protein
MNKELVPYSLFDFNIFSRYFMQMLYLIILMIDPCNSYADISKITTNAVSIGVSSSVPYSELNNE